MIMRLLLLISVYLYENSTYIRREMNASFFKKKIEIVSQVFNLLQGFQPDAKLFSEYLTNYYIDNTLQSEYKNAKYLIKYEHLY